MFALLTTLAPLVTLVLSQRATTPATSNFPFGDIADPCKQCVDIKCYEPITWSDSKEEVCRNRMTPSCSPKSQRVCIDVPKTICEWKGYTECTTNNNPTPVRDDKVGGERFDEQKCDIRPIPVVENKEKPECFNMTKKVCEKMWVPEAPFWKDVNCKDLTWENCTLIPHPHEIELDYCDCKPTELWYNKYEKVETSVSCPITTCVPKAYYECQTIQEEICDTVYWDDCETKCDRDCDMQHFKQPSQEPDHRRWCSHVEISLPSGVKRPYPCPGSETKRAPRILQPQSASSNLIQPQFSSAHSQRRTVPQQHPRSLPLHRVPKLSSRVSMFQ